MDNMSAYLSPTSVLKLGDISPWIFTLLLVFSNVVLTILTNQLGVPYFIVISINWSLLILLHASL